MIREKTKELVKDKKIIPNYLSITKEARDILENFEEN